MATFVLYSFLLHGKNFCYKSCKAVHNRLWDPYMEIQFHWFHVKVSTCHCSYPNIQMINHHRNVELLVKQFLDFWLSTSPGSGNHNHRAWKKKIICFDQTIYTYGPGMSWTTSSFSRPSSTLDLEVNPPLTGNLWTSLSLAVSTTVCPTVSRFLPTNSREGRAFTWLR